MLLRCILFLLAIFALPAATIPAIVAHVRTVLATGDFNSARQELKQYRSALGVTSEYLEALSWVGRAHLAAKQYAAAEENAAEVRKLALEMLAHRKLDADASLPMALGASIEVQAQAGAAQGNRDQAVTFLRQEVFKWHATSIRARIQKNLNLLSLEGKPAPELEVAASVAGPKPRPLSLHRGHPVLLFFWAHWCSDCKQELAVVEKLQQTYGSRGLEVIAPTQHYGYVAGGQDAPVSMETAYIKAVFNQFYAGLGAVETPLSEENFGRYGVSSTPTMVLVDSAGIVRMYNPGNVSYQAFSGKIEGLLPTSRKN